MKPLILLLLSCTLHATSITVSTSAGLFSQRVGMSTVTFDGLNANTPEPYTSGGATYSRWSAGAAPFVSGSVAGEHAAPVGDNTTYLSVGSPGHSSEVLITFATPINYFGMYMGSPDTYNAISFYTESMWIGTLLGGQLIPPGGGNQATSRYLNFDVKYAPVKYIILYSEQAAFESDNHAFGVSNPEPGTFLLVGLGLAVTMRLRKK